MSKSLSNYFFKDELHLRGTLDKDIDELVSIINDAYSYQNNAKGEPRTSPTHLRKRVSETDFYTMLHGEDIIGCVYLEPKEQALHFGLLTLVPRYRGKAIGEAMQNLQPPG